MANDQSTAAHTGCCMGQAWMVDDGLGLPKRWRHDEVAALTGFQLANVSSQVGMCWVGTKALEMKARGNTMSRPRDCADSGPLLTRPRQAQPQLRAKANRRAMPKPAATDSALVSVRQPMASPVSATMVVQTAALSRSATDRPARTAERHMGRVRNRSITPVDRSVLIPTAGPMAEVVRFNSSSPEMA